MATIIEYYPVTLDDDGFSGGVYGPPPVVASFLSENAAVAYAKTKGCYHSVGKKRSLIVFDTPEEVEQFEKDQLKLSALAKLTQKEREALGI